MGEDQLTIGNMVVIRDSDIDGGLGKPDVGFGGLLLSRIIAYLVMDLCWDYLLLG